MLVFFFLPFLLTSAKSRCSICNVWTYGLENWIVVQFRYGCIKCIINTHSTQSIQSHTGVCELYAFSHSLAPIRNYLILFPSFPLRLSHFMTTKHCAHLKSQEAFHCFAFYLLPIYLYVIYMDIILYECFCYCLVVCGDFFSSLYYSFLHHKTTQQKNMCATKSHKCSHSNTQNTIFLMCAYITSYCTYHFWWRSWNAEIFEKKENLFETIIGQTNEWVFVFSIQLNDCVCFCFVEGGIFVTPSTIVRYAGIHGTKSGKIRILLTFARFA